MNEKLALSDDILLSCEKPERYIGNEVNSVTKDLKDVKIRFAFCFPDVYEIGMSHLGIQILYGMFNSYDDVWCERVYSPWTDMDKVMRDNKIELFALESQDPVKKFDFLGFTLQYELCYTNILQVLDLSGIPFTSAERTDWSTPIIIGGGPCTYNPEPIADFFDIFYIGEGENHYRALFDLYEQCKADGTSRRDFLIKAASIPGMYVPSLYEVKYKEDGTIESMNPTVEGIPSHITKDIVTDLDHAFYPSKPVVPFIKATQDRIVLEVMRGCIRGCRFCQAGQLYRPKREKSHEVLEKQALELLKNTGYEEISLSSLSTSDYEQLPQLLDFLLKECGSKHVNISLPSLRIDNFSLDVMSKVQDIKKSSLTFAAEAGSQRLRDVINKGVTEEDIIRGSHEAFLGGWNKVKFYFMLGHPWETDEDIAGIGEICNRVAAEYFDTVPKEKRNGQSVEITASTSFFVPKPFTPFQWAPMCRPEEFLEKAAKTKAGIRSQVNQKRIKYNWHEANASMLEGVFARGDRKLCKAILRAYEKGCIYDAWGEYFKYDVWMETFEELGIDPWFYVSRTRSDDEIFPWDILDCGVTKSFLLREWHTSQEAKISKNCANQCLGCGARQYGVGICMEPKTDKNVGYAV